MAGIGVPAGGVRQFKFTTKRFSTGEPYTLAGTPAISVYKGGSTTQSTSGVTLTVDFDGVTGLNYVAIDTSADATFYADGASFDVVITTGTVDSVSWVGTVVDQFDVDSRIDLMPESFWDYVLEGGYTAGEMHRLNSSVLWGGVSGFPGSPVFKGIDGTTNRVAATVDSFGNRSGFTINAT